VVTGKADNDRLDLSAQLLFGGIIPIGKLAFDMSKYRKGDGIFFPASNRLSYVLPEELGIDSVKLSQKMDSLVGIGLKANAFPGCQLLLAKKGMVFYNKSYGFHRYDQREPVLNDDIYDLASVTKVLGPVPALMILADQKKFQVSQKMSKYWPDWKGSNKEGILVSDLLSHQARLKPGVVLYPQTLDNKGGYKPEYYATQPTPGYELRVAENLYLINGYQDTIYKVIRDSPLLKTKKYAYSDLGFVILPKVIENLSGESYETFLQRKLYNRLGVSSLMYNPYLHVPMEKIVPTEDDRIFRHDLLQGFVHDETAAMMGGISGNAGLFGSAGDIAKVMQLYLQNGEYGNERYISAETVKNWTSSHFQKTNNRRGFGFDKPGIQTGRQTGKERYPSSVVSEQSYGHSGFTGTFVWADPANELLFVFLSNRVFPQRDNHKINKLWLRPLLLETFFKLAGDKPASR
jgi:beta-N-acetylhexosaminidase